jgi:hypothetical protein
VSKFYGHKIYGPNCAHHYPTGEPNTKGQKGEDNTYSCPGKGRVTNRSKKMKVNKAEFLIEKRAAGRTETASSLTNWNFLFFSFVFPLLVLEFELRASHFARQVLFHLNHTSSPFGSA